jgi:CubicO group peptidase (beta-lactamase class C family)
MRNYLNKIVQITIFISLVFHTGIYAQDTASQRKLVSRIDSILQGQVDGDKIPGAVVQIKKGGSIIYKQAYGFAQKYKYPHELLYPPDTMHVDCLFDLASLTKVVGTTTAIMLLVDRGLLKIEDPVGKYISAFNSPEKSAITIRNLLTHTAGLYEWYPLYYFCTNKEETYRLIGELPLKYPVGMQRKYSDLGFIILAELIEKVSGLPLEQFLQKNVFTPLAMNNTTYNPLKTGRFTRIAATSHGNPYEKRMVHDSTLGFQVKGLDPDKWDGWRTYTLKGEVNDGNAWYANGGISGAAGLFSTVDDLQKLVDMLINKGRAGDQIFIQPGTIDLFLTQDKFRNGLGWMMDPASSWMKNAPVGSFGHTGFTGTSIIIVPSLGISMILLINRQNTGLLKSGEYYNVSPVRQQVFEAVMNAYKPSGS